MEVLKKDVVDEERKKRFKNEKFILESSKSPFLVKLMYILETPDRICLFKTFIEYKFSFISFRINSLHRGGPLFAHLQQQKRFDEQRYLFGP